MAEINDNDVRAKWVNTNKDGSYPKDSGYPKDNGRYSKPSLHTLQPSDHFRTDGDGASVGVPNGYLGGEDLMKNPPPRFSPITRQLDDNSYIVKDKGEHFIRDLNDTNNSDPKSRTRPVIINDSNVIMPSILNGSGNSPNKVVFSGATTNVNPTNDPVKQQIIDYGLSDYEEERFKKAGGDYKPPLSVMHPFTRMIDQKNMNDHQISNLTTFNRYHLPIADLEHRKAFRHVFFTRPECYVCCIDDTSYRVKLCQQAEYDEDFNTSYSRMPYITKMLAPVYVTGTFGRSGIIGDNFNYLLSNRCMGLAPSGATLSQQETIGKSIQGYTVTPGMHYEGRQGSTISITFRDTKYLEVYEFIRMWMLYIWKIKYGIFAPSFNNYRYINEFPKPGLVKNPSRLHPFDRAIDYTCSMFDFINDESDTFPRYWCKYFGMYPIDVQIEGLSNSNNDALKEEMSVVVSFKYAYKIENTTKSLIEFNYNAGICDNLGQLTSDGSSVLEYSEQFAYANNPTSEYMKSYIGPGAPFVGTPYVVLTSVGKDIMHDMESGTTMSPCLRFSPLSADKAMSQRLNMGIESISKNTNLPAQSDLTDVKKEAAKVSQKAAEIKESEDMALSEVIRTGVAIENEYLDKVSEKVDHINDIGIGGAFVEYFENK